MRINISELISTNLKKQSFAPEIEMEAFALENDQYPFIKKEPVQLSIQNKSNSVVRISGKIDVILDIPCSRCLTSVPTPIVCEFDREIDFKKLQQEKIEDQEETSFIEESFLDVDKFVYDEILIHLPMKTLCSEDCKGLCFQCGRNLNEGECGCDRASQDLRMSAIRDIFNNFKEV